MKWQNETQKELLDQAYKGSIPTGAFSSLAGLLFSVMLWEHVPLTLLLPWCVVFFFSQSLRMGAALYRNKNKQKYKPDYWERLFAFSVIIPSLLWGILPIITFEHVDDITRAIISIFLATAPIAQLLSVVGIFRVWLFSMALLLLPMCLSWFFFGLPGIILGMVGILYATYLYAVGQKFHRLMGDKIELSAKADAALRAKTTFLATASHDLRQPLHAMTMSLAAAQARLEQKFPSENELEGARKSLRNVDGSIESLSHLLNALLDISKLESGTIVPNFSALPVSNLFDYIDRTYHMRALDKGLGFKIITSKLTVQTDPIYIQRILGNLVSNAVRHIPSGRILIGCRKVEDHARFYVIDNGPGIPLEKFCDIFDEFNQLDNPGRQSNAGQGLGLSIADRLARMLNHPLSVQSIEGKGACFTLDVPLSQSVPDTLDKETKSIVGRRQTQLVVLVDPNSATLEETSVQIRNWGYRVLAFQSCEEAQNLHIRPHVIISAQIFPSGLNGFETVNILRGTWRTDAPAIVTITDFDPEALLEASKYNCRIIPNPPDPDEFKKSIQSAIAKLSN